METRRLSDSSSKKTWASLY